jgi:hypothetical protein
MVISPNIFTKVKRKPFFSDSSLHRQLEAFKTVDVCSSAIAVVSLAMFNKTVNISFGSDSSITLQCVRENRRASFHPRFYEGNKSSRLNVRNHFRPNLIASAQDTENALIGCPPAPFGVSTTVRECLFFQWPHK